MKKFKEIYHHPIFRVVSLLMIIWITASIGILYLEDSNVENAPSRIQDSFWWAIVTITTVGYGDYAPETFY